MQPATEHDIALAADILVRGGTVVFPTETVYGLGANALDAHAVAKVFAAKGRPSFDPLIVHAATIADAFALVDAAAWDDGGTRRDVAERLAEAFWPGPLTLVLPKSPRIPGLVTSGLPTVGLRVPGHAIARRLIELAGVPVAAPSANLFGSISPTRAQHVRVPRDALLDGGPCITGVESTIVGFDGAGQPVVYRLGGVALEAVEAVVGAAVVVANRAAAPTPGLPGLPGAGMLDKHYAPRTPMRLVSRLDEIDPAELGDKRVGLLNLEGDAGRDMGFAEVEALAPLGDLTAAAARLFEAMHALDAAGLDLIVAELVPERGLGRAINDRLRRASAH